MGPKYWSVLGIEDPRTLYKKYVCRNHFFETYFTTPERRWLNRGAVPCRSVSVNEWTK